MPTLIENRTLEDNIHLCKELGLSFVELNMNFPEYQIDKIQDVDWFCKKADEASIYYTIHLDENMNIADFNPLVRDAYLETMRRTIEVAKQFVTLKDKYGKNEQPLILNMHMHDGIYIDTDLSLCILPINEVADKDNFYPISGLIRMDENNMIEVDCDATDELANQYIFIE